MRSETHGMRKLLSGLCIFTGLLEQWPEVPMSGLLLGLCFPAPHSGMASPWCTTGHKDRPKTLALRCPLGEEGVPDSAGLLGKHWVNDKVVEKSARRQATGTLLQGMYGPSFITPCPTSLESQLLAETPCPPQAALETFLKDPVYRMTPHPLPCGAIPGELLFLSGVFSAQQSHHPSVGDWWTSPPAFY